MSTTFLNATVTFSIKISAFYCRHQHNSDDTTRVQTTQTINYEDSSRNAASPTDNATERTGHFGGKSSETNKHVIDIETMNVVNKEDGDVQLTVPNYTDNSKGLFTRNVKVNVPEKFLIKLFPWQQMMVFILHTRGGFFESI